MLLCFTASDVFADFLGNIEFYPRFVYGSRHDEVSPLKRYAQGAFLFSPSREAFNRYDSDYSLSGPSTQDNSGLLSISTPGGTSFYGLRSLNLGRSFTAHDSTVPWNAPSYYLGGSDWLSAPSPGINFMLRYESLVLGIGVSPNWGYSNYDEGLRIDYPPQVRLLGGLEFQHFGLQPSLTLMQSEMPDGSSSLPAQDGWMLEVPFSVNIGSFGATLSAHYGVNLGHLYDGSRTTLYPGAASTTQSYLSSSGDPADVRGYGGFFDLSLGSRPVKVQVLGASNLWKPPDGEMNIRILDGRP